MVTFEHANSPVSLFAGFFIAFHFRPGKITGNTSGLPGTFVQNLWLRKSGFFSAV
jgi:hypothetical protein